MERASEPPHWDGNAQVFAPTASTLYTSNPAGDRPSFASSRSVLVAKYRACRCFPALYVKNEEHEDRL
jgi:hypothetical protein